MLFVAVQQKTSMGVNDPFGSARCAGRKHDDQSLIEQHLFELQGHLQCTVQKAFNTRALDVRESGRAAYDHNSAVGGKFARAGVNLSRDVDQLPLVGIRRFGEQEYWFKLNETINKSLSISQCLSGGPGPDALTLAMRMRTYFFPNIGRERGKYSANCSCGQEQRQRSSTVTSNHYPIGQTWPTSTNCRGFDHVQVTTSPFANPENFMALA